MMDRQTALDTAKAMLADGKLPNVAAANVMIVKLVGVMEGGRMDRETRSALMAAVKAGEIGRLPKKGLGPEMFYHKNARGEAIAAQERIFYGAVEALRKVYATPDHKV